MVVGLISSALTRLIGLPHLLSSIVTIGLFHGINQFVLGAANFSISQYTSILDYIVLVPAAPALCMLALIFCLLLLGALYLMQTQLGYAFAVYGNNPRFFHYYGISSSFVFVMGICTANGLAGLAGASLAQSSGFVDVSMGFGMSLFCIAALILGKTVVAVPFRFGPLVAAGGVLLYFIIQQLLLKVGFDLKYFTMVQSLIVLAILAYRFRVRVQERGAAIDHLGV